ncbi:hypothetical protein ABBQ38_007241 [Trebouxia sp. C0009 RCD-2024]
MQFASAHCGHQASCHTLGRKLSQLDISVPSRPAAARVNRSCRALADGAAVHAAAVAERPRVDLVPKPVTSVLQDLTRFHGLPSLSSTNEFHEAERCFTTLLGAQNLDVQLRTDKDLQQAAQTLEEAVSTAAASAFSSATGDHKNAKAAHTFLQRILYRINRLCFFWYDDLRNYSNERSLYLAQLRDSIEEPWQQWELSHFDVESYKSKTVEQLKDMVRQQAAHDVDPPLSEAASYIKNEMSKEGYRHLLAVGSVDGLVEASRQSRVCGGAPNEIMCAIFRVLMEEYGTGRFNKKHSTFFATMMRELELNEEPEFYFDLVPWQSLASINHNFLLTERRRHYLRYAGGLTFFEVNGPSVYRSYLAAAQRVGLSDAAAGYWELHIKEDERHGRQMVEDVAVPLIEQYGAEDGWEVVFGYDQEKMMGARAGAALVIDLKDVDSKQSTPAMSMV